MFSSPSLFPSFSYFCFLFAFSLSSNSIVDHMMDNNGGVAPNIQQFLNLCRKEMKLDLSYITAKLNLPNNPSLAIQVSPLPSFFSFSFLLFLYYLAKSTF